LKRLSQEEEIQVPPQEVQITPEEREAWFQNSIPLLEKYQVPQEYYPYYRQLANISASERLYTIAVNNWGKYIDQIKNGLDTPEDYQAIQILRKNPGFNNFPQERIKDYIRFLQNYPDLYEKYNWSFYQSIMENPNFFQDDNKQLLLSRFFYFGSSHPKKQIDDAINFIERISAYPEIFNYLVDESNEKYEITKTYLDFCNKYPDQVDFFAQGLRRFKFINSFYNFINQFAENNSINFKEAREAFELIDNETSKLTAYNIKKVKENLKTPEDIETFNKVTRRFFDGTLATPYERDLRESSSKEEYGFFSNVDQHREIDSLIFLAKTTIGKGAANLPDGKLYIYLGGMYKDALNQLIKVYYFYKNNGNLSDEEIIEKCNDLKLFDESGASNISIQKVLSNNQDYQNIVLQKSGLSHLKNDGNLDFLKDFYYIFTYLNQDTIQKILQEISHKLNITLTSDNVELIKSQFNLIQPRIISLLQAKDTLSRTFIPNSFIKDFLNFFFNKYPYHYSNILKSLIDNIQQIPTEKFSPRYFDELVIKYIKSDLKYSRFDDFEGDILDYVSLYETGNTYLNKLDLSDEQIEKIKQLYDQYSKEFRFPKSTLINLAILEVTQGVELSGEFAKNFKNHDLLDKISDTIFESKNKNPKDIEFILNKFSNLVTPYFLVAIANSLKYKTQRFIEQIKSLPLEIMLCLILDGDDVELFELDDSEARDYINKFDRQYRNLHKNTREYFVVLCFTITYKNLFGMPSNLMISGINNDIDKDGSYEVIEQSTDAYSFLLLIFGKNITNWLRKFNDPHDAVQGFNIDFNWPRSEKAFGDYLLKATLGYKNLSTFPTQKIKMIQNYWLELTEEEKQLPFAQLYSVCDVKNFKKIHSEYDVKSDKFASEYQSAAMKSGFEPLQEHYLNSLNVPLPSWSNVVISKGGYTGRFLPRSDARGIFLGKHTDCCQSPGDAGEGAALYGQIEPTSAFFVVENKKGQIIAQSWVWEDVSKKIIVFDNIEGKGLGYNDDDTDEERLQKLKRQKQIFELYTAFSNMMPDEYSVYVGGGYSKVDLEELADEDKVEQEFDYKASIPRKNYVLDTDRNRIIIDDDKIYSDAYKQFRILRSNNSE